MPWNLLFGVFGSEISFAVKKENGWDHFHGVAISPLPSFWLYYFTLWHFLYAWYRYYVSEQLFGNFQANSQKTMLTTNQRNMSTMLRYHMRLSILWLSIDMNHLPSTPVIITIAQDLHIFSAFCVFVMLKVLNLPIFRLL